MDKLKTISFGKAAIKKMEKNSSLLCETVDSNAAKHI